MTPIYNGVCSAVCFCPSVVVFLVPSCAFRTLWKAVCGCTQSFSQQAYHFRVEAVDMLNIMQPVLPLIRIKSTSTDMDADQTGTVEW